MIGRRRAELEALVDEVAPSGWRGDRRWRALVTAAAICEPWARRGAGYLPASGEPVGDALVGSPGPGPTDLAEWIGWAIAAAHAVVGALAAREGDFPGQPLRVRIERRRGRCRVTPAAAPTTVAFAIGERVELATLDARGPAAELALARRLAVAANGASSRSGTGTGADGGAAGAPIAVVSIGDQPLAVAHHGHRRGWNQRGGPWLGVARAEGLGVLSACRFAVDGFGHAQLAADLARTIDRGAVRALAAVAASITGDTPPPPLPELAVADLVPLGVAWRRLPAPTPPVASQAWTLGRLLAIRPGGVRARGTTLRIPVAAGPLDDPTRFARRARTALVTVRFADGAPEPYLPFAARVREAIAAEAVGRGLVSRLVAALDGAPVPLGLQRRLLGVPRGALAEVLAGDGCVSLLRLAGLPPLVAAAAPARTLDLDAGEATAVLTVIDDGTGGATATIAGRGSAGSAAGAAELLAAWTEGQADVRAATITA